MSAKLNTVPQDHVALGAARVALAALWCATVTTFDVFAPPRFRIGGGDVVDASTAARQLVAQAGRARPVSLSAAPWTGEALSIILTPAADDDDRWCTFADWLPHNAHRALVLAAGRGLQVNREILSHLDGQYRLIASIGGSGGPPDDSSIEHLRLPDAWLTGVDFVLLLGRSAPNSSATPISASTGFDSALIDDLTNRFLPNER
jgi:hypothetical protein